MVKCDDDTLIKQALAGDQDAFAFLLDKYRGAVYGLTYKMVRDKHDADDIVQETFIKAFSALASFNTQFAFSTWLFKIASNSCIDYLRKKKLHTVSIDKPTERNDGPQFKEIPNRIDNPEMELIASENRSRIDRAIDQLPENYRTVIILRHKKEKSYDEISEVLGIPIGTVKARIFRAREKLKLYLKDILEQ